MKRTLLAGVIVAIGALGSQAGAPGGMSMSFIDSLRNGYNPTAAERALANAVAGNAIDKLAATRDSRNGADTHFSHRVESKGITDQKRSGRCWLFTGLNVLRAQMMQKNNLPKLELSQAYNFFYDQLEKSNLFLQQIIDTSTLPDDDRTVDWLFSNALSDGGQFTGLADNVMKYGVVPAQVMGETFSTDNTSRLSGLIALKLREDGLKLRGMAAKGVKNGDLDNEKRKMLGEIYRMLSIGIGEPPVEFEWTRYDKNGKPVDTRTYTPQQFYKEYAGNDLQHDYVMFMNDPSRPFYKLYEIDRSRHVYDGDNWRYINLPVEDIKAMAIESIKDSTMMYFSCDVGKFIDRDKGILDTDNYDYGSLLGVDFGIDKGDRIKTHASASSHAMTLMAVDLDEKGKPRKWMVENSWGSGPNDGHLIISDRWFDEYMFRLVVDRKYVPKKILSILNQKPVLLPAWDPLF